MNNRKSMNYKYTNVDFNSEILSELKAKNSLNQEKSMVSWNDTFPSNAWESQIENLQKSPYFKTQVLESGEILFDEGERNSSLYIIKRWLLSVEKYTNTLRNEVKQLAILKNGDILWEASIWEKNQKKEARIRAIDRSEVIYIDGKIDLKRFIIDFPLLGYELLRHIIFVTNKRLLEANKINTSHYEIERAINAITQITQRSIFNLIDVIKNIVGVDSILYFEKHQILDKFLTLKYDSRQPQKMQDKIFERSWYFLNLTEVFQECSIDEHQRVIIHKLSIGTKVFWYLLFIKAKGTFDESDKKIFSSLGNSLAWVIQKLFLDRDEQTQNYIQNMKK